MITGSSLQEFPLQARVGRLSTTLTNYTTRCFEGTVCSSECVCVCMCVCVSVCVCVCVGVVSCLTKYMYDIKSYTQYGVYI